MSEQVFRLALIAIRVASTEKGVLEIVDAALNSSPPDPPKKALSSKERQQRRRDKNKHSNGHQLDLGVTENVTGVTQNVTASVTNVTENVTRPVTRLARGEISDSLSFHEDTEEEREDQRERARESVTESVTRVTATSRQTSRNVTASRDATATAERYVDPADKLTDELRAIAAGATGATPVVDVESAWLKFTGHHAGKWVHVAGAWQMWCVREAKRERSDRAAAPVDDLARKRAAAADAEQRQRAHVAKLLRGSGEPRKVGE